MKFTQALHQFIIEIKKEYGGGHEGITKIGLDYTLYDKIMYELANDKSMRFHIRDLSEPEILGVKIYPRERDKF